VFNLGFGGVGFRDDDHFGAGGKRRRT
jgi:hypothetical protein